jgi:hypothetical protein
VVVFSGTEWGGGSGIVDVAVAFDLRMSFGIFWNNNNEIDEMYEMN